MSESQVTLLLGGQERTLKFGLKAWARLQNLCPDRDLSKLDSMPPFEILPLVIQAGLDPKELPSGFDADLLDEWISDCPTPEQLGKALEAWQASAGFIQAVFAGMARSAAAVAPVKAKK
jgi:hypothetical protein